MTKNSILKIFAVLFLTLVLFSCEKENEIVSSETISIETIQTDLTKNFVVKNGIMCFNDMQSFTDVITELNENQELDLTQWLNDAGFETSMYVARKDENYLAPTIIEDPAFASIVNKEGVFVIGNEIHKMIEETEYIITDGSFETLKKIEAGNTENLENVTKFQITSGFGNELKEYGDKNYFYIWNSTRRFILSAWNRHFGAYASNGIQIQHQRKSAIGWIDSQMYWGKVSGTAYAAVWLTGLPAIFTYVTNSDQKYNHIRVDRALHWITMDLNANVNIDTDNIVANYWFKLNSGDAARTWSTTWYF